MEGFGLPAVEAAACGCPVVATTASPLPALLPGAGLFIEPNEAAIASALVDVLDSPERRKQMSEAGLLAASRLTWSRAAQQLMDVLHQVARP
jgi:glycosyltransferase involved in cell wall biosynthesis